ncbi:MAG TPA: hypothetical protein VD788_02480 [Candidatus Polarisedimenticolaceae bacterium]|nr:hypothetical protein [Candidatus Polarisedimenticolaceae bacterium]
MPRARWALVCVVSSLAGAVAGPIVVAPAWRQATTTVSGDARGALGVELGVLAGTIAAKAAGGVYEYDRSRRHERTETLATDIAGSSGSGAEAGETVGDVGYRHFADLLGDWKLEIWATTSTDRRISATGSARASPAGDRAVRIRYGGIEAEGLDRSIDGYTLLSYLPGRGFDLENSFDTLDRPRRFVGEYLVNQNAYTFYPIDDRSATIVRSRVRVDLRISSPKLWVVETYTLIDGKEVQVQSYRFSRT